MECALWCSQHRDLVLCYCKSEGPYALYHGQVCACKEQGLSLLCSTMAALEGSEDRSSRRGDEEGLFLEAVDR